MTEIHYPEVTVGALIFNMAGKVFLMKTYKWSNRYAVPGGHIELGERIEDALKREVKEETGLEIHDSEFVSLQESIFDETFWEKKHFIFLDFICKTRTSSVKLNDEGQEYVWVLPEEALKLPLDKYTERLIKSFIRKYDKTALYIQ
jgi:nucleoside triphosphatase